MKTEHFFNDNVAVKMKRNERMMWSEVKGNELSNYNYWYHTVHKGYKTL